jgi:hypothetical protein
LSQYFVVKETKMCVIQISIQREYQATVQSYSNPGKITMKRHVKHKMPKKDHIYVCIYTGLFKMIVGVLTTCNTQYT